MIELKGISTIYEDDFMALNNVNLEIKDGEFVSLVGPSGAGKSTLMKLMTRELRPDHGEILIDGVDISQLSQNEVPLLRRKIGTIFQ
ncbi:MAG: ATP-binding cassette domain-containing protein, partial [Patescibacteria group bacterium]